MKIKNIWIDHLNSAIVWRLFLFSKREEIDIAAVHYFGKKSSIAGLLFSYIFFPKSKLIKLTYDLDHHDHKDREALFWHNWRESAAFGVKVSLQVKYSSLIKYLPENYQKSGLLYLQRQIAYDQKRYLGIIRLVDWHIQKRKIEPNEQIVFFSNAVNFVELTEFSKSFNLVIKGFNDQHSFFWLIIRLFHSIYLFSKYFFLEILSSRINLCEVKNAEFKIGVFYAQGADLNKRSDLFWLPQSGINSKDIVVYFMSPQYPPTTARVNELTQLGVQWFSLVNIKDNKVSNDPLKTRRYTHFYHQGLKTVIELAWKIFKETNLKLLSQVWQAERLLWLINRVAIFEALFQACQIKVHFGLFSEDDQNLMAVHIALKNVEGIDTYMHWSHQPEGQIMPAHDIYFYWGPYFRSIYERFPHGISNLVYTGYQFDDKFESLKTEAFELRRNMQQRGVKHTVCFFDNSYVEGGWFSRESLIAVNKELLKKVAQHKDWGIILKPKRVKSFEVVRVDEVEGLMNDLIKQGRCILFDKGELPTLAALASDLVIGFGAFSTPATESVLAKIPVIIYDPSNQYSHFLYKERLTNVVFNDIEPLLQFTENFFLRELTQISDRDYNILLNRIDPYRDGKAAKRVGTYIRDLFAGFQQKKSCQQVIESATKNFVEKYGSDKIIQFSGIQ